MRYFVVFHASHLLPNISSERTAHTIRFFVYRTVRGCGPPLKLAVGRDTKSHR